MKKNARLHRDPHGHAKELCALLRENAYRHRLPQVFSDFCEMSALSMSNAVDPVHREAREARYMKIIDRYNREEIERFPRMLGILTDWISCDMRDCLGALFMMLDLGNAYKGQFFTPFEVAQLMAGLTVGDAVKEIARMGFILVSEPAAGAGGMLIAMADALQQQGINYQQTMHATAVDVDATAVHMAYVQLSLLHVPAIVIHGNSLTLEQWDYWVTPAHVLGEWDSRLKLRSTYESMLGVLAAADVDDATNAQPSKAEPITFPEVAPV